MWLMSRAAAPFISVIACSIGLQTVQFNYWEYRLSNCDYLAAVAASAAFDAGDVDDGQKLDALECRPRA